MGNLRTLLTTVFLLAILCFKISSLHVYTHHDGTEDSIENCASCLFTIENQQAEFSITSPAQVVITSEAIPYQNKVVSFTSIFEINIPHLLRLESRPPPMV